MPVPTSVGDSHLPSVSQEIVLLSAPDGSRLTPIVSFLAPWIPSTSAIPKTPTTAAKLATAAKLPHSPSKAKSSPPTAFGDAPADGAGENRDDEDGAMDVDDMTDLSDGSDDTLLRRPPHRQPRRDFPAGFDDQNVAPPH